MRQAVVALELRALLKRDDWVGTALALALALAIAIALTLTRWRCAASTW